MLFSFNQISFLSVLTLLVLFLGCSGSDSNSNADKNNPQNASEENRTDQQFDSSYAPGDTLTFQGKLIDTHCYNLDQQNIGDDHTLPKSGFREDCAAYCANLGYPVAVLIDGNPGNKVWILRFSAQVFADYMAETVRVEGNFISDGLVQPSKVEMKTDEGWIQII